MIRRVLWGVDRPPRGVAWDHPRLPVITLGATPLRLNSQPVPPALLEGGTDRRTRPASVLAWLEAGCGAYAGRRRRFMADYLASAGEAIAGSALDERMNRFAGLYAAEDWTWSALRPLPRAWVEYPGGATMADMLFWDGRQALAVLLSGGDESALAGAGVDCLRLEGGQDLRRVLPRWITEVWQGDILPASPFRRALPDPC